jgi:hypothetical protein
MENLELKGTKGVPTVLFNIQTGLIELIGQSYQETAAEYFDQLMQQLEKYISQIRKPLTVNFKLTYFNSGSSQRILNILFKLSEYKENNGNVAVNWFFDEEDLDMKDLVNDYIQISKLNINLIPDPEMKWE